MPLPAEEVQARLRGVLAGLLTPFDEDGEIRHSAIESNAATLAGRGINTFLAAANISEYHSLSHDERVAVTKSSIEGLPSETCVLAGVGGSTPDATRLISEYERLGVDAMMVMPPDHTYVHEKGLLDYYRELDESTERPLVPYVRGFDPSVEYLAALSRIDGVLGIKYALPDPVSLGAAVDEGDDDVVWVDGLAEPYAVPFWNEGIEGFSAGVSNFRPEVGLSLFDALSASNWERARSIRNICLPFQNFRDETGDGSTIPGGISVPAVKKGLELAGLEGGTVREPLRPLSDADERRAAELYDALDENIERVIGGTRPRQ